jgi:hypothetical protein
MAVRWARRVSRQVTPGSRPVTSSDWSSRGLRSTAAPVRGRRCDALDQETIATTSPALSRATARTIAVSPTASLTSAGSQSSVATGGRMVITWARSSPSRRAGQSCAARRMSNDCHPADLPPSTDRRLDGDQIVILCGPLEAVHGNLPPAAHAFGAPLPNRYEQGIAGRHTARRPNHGRASTSPENRAGLETASRSACSRSDEQEHDCATSPESIAQGHGRLQGWSRRVAGLLEPEGRAS